MLPTASPARSLSCPALGAAMQKGSSQSPHFPHCPILFPTSTLPSHQPGTHLCAWQALQWHQQFSEGQKHRIFLHGTGMQHPYDIFPPTSWLLFLPKTPILGEAAPTGHLAGPLCPEHSHLGQNTASGHAPRATNRGAVPAHCAGETRALLPGRHLLKVAREVIQGQ